MKSTVLIVADWFEPGYKAGGPIASLKNIIAAIKEDANVYLLTRNCDIDDTTTYDLPTQQWLDKEGYKIMYLEEARFGDRGYIFRLINTIEPTYIYLNSFFSPKASILYVLKRKLHPKIILAPRGEFGSGSISIKRLKKKLFLTVAGALKLYDDISFHASSELEADNIRAHVKVKDVHIAPDLVDTSRIKRKNGYVKQKGVLKLCFVSRIIEYKNVRSCIDALHHMGADGQKISLDIYGPIEQEEYWQECTNLIERYKLGDRIKYKGTLRPDEVANAFSRYDLFFFPTWGENFGHVIFESLSVGTPVILARTTLWHRLPQQPVWSYFHELNDMDAACGILRTCLEMDSDEYDQLSRNAFSVANNFANDPDLVNKTKALFRIDHG